ncbi:MAG: hypothetical protein ACD_17C00444G0003 [uncultured bacterium]|nr:MAG: hypothetical protein ACD_17C00444G0003 [uncultured bacterium]OGN55672.1 MAG: hypothetical protein A2796_00655 [Chlamydiae bacterium RIFCSPHIGHO2_01_FULL_44_39]OGN59160.1 MAG: hypothetical protein A3C42_00115 [Chlamydiae bacterium RIFCSPHIGHO2_02_FULL_45_9]OGN60464.1 MAG: hypothetical protein A3D96_01080 [Chlamydiae bacterium RIFCSPHIGHO2_12_FULL_44_59]OGN66585.1 MAG: hypothetical protein A2978_05265 [Chlamydiae bacterium RIFCSPLOWO2_01_FULL_44_52]OGN69834.1 MAG: hypothetical protein A3
MVISRDRKWFILFAMSMAFFVAAIDGTVMNLAVVWIQSDFHASLSSVQWVLSGFLLSFASFTVAAGKLSDHYGHKRVFTIGVLVFLFFSISGALSQTTWQLIVSRILQGFGAALFWPSVNALTLHSFDGKSRGTAMGILTGIMGLAMTIGPPLGGFLIDLWNWRLILWFNVPLCVLSLVMTYYFVPEDEKHERGKIDFFAIFLILLGFFSFFYALNRGGTIGFNRVEVMIAFVMATLAFLTFVMHECYAKRPLIDFTLLKSGTYVTSVLVRVGTGASFFAVLFVLAFYLQHIVGLSAVKAGLYYLPMTIMMGIIPPILGRMQRRVGSYFPMYFGAILICLSFIYFLFLDWTAITFSQLFLPLFFFGLGIGLILPSNIMIALQEIPKTLTGLGIGILYTCILVSGTTLVILSTQIIREKGTSAAMRILRKDEVFLTPLQQMEVANAVTGLNDPHLFAQEFPGNEAKVAYAVRYGFEEAFFLILKICVIVSALVLLIFAYAHLYRLKNFS